MYNNRHEKILKINILDKISEFPVSSLYDTHRVHFSIFSILAKNALHKIQQNANHETQFMISITPTYFGIGVPSSESLRTKTITSFGLVSLRAQRITSRFVTLCARRLPEDGSPVPKHARMVLIMNEVLWFAFLYFIVFPCLVNILKFLTHC